MRALAGTEPGQAAPVAAGARVVALSGATVPAGLQAHERGASLEWRFAPSGRAFTDPVSGAAAVAYDARDLRPLSPVHLRVARSSGDLAFSWRRRTRIGGDDWTSPEVPLGETEERYLFELLDEGDVVLSREVTTPATTVTASEESALFADAPRYAFEVRIAQVSSAFGPGAPRQATVYT